MYNILLYDRPSISATNFRQNITQLAQDWHHSIKNVGGFWIGDFGIGDDQLSRGEIIDFYNRSIGWRIEERSYGFITWEGRISQLKLSIDGAEYTRSLDPEHWHNKVAVRYPPTITAWSENTDSSDLYGESGYVDSVGGTYNDTAAVARRDRRLAEYAYPRSRATGGLASAKEARGVQLDVLCTGYVFTINQRYRLTDTAAANVSTQISTLVGESEFVTAGTIDANILQAPISTEGIPTRLWDLIEELLGMGDDSGDMYVGGVYAGRVFNANLAETTVTHYWRNNTLYDAAGNPVLPTHIKPDIVVELVNAPRSQTIPGGGTKDKPNRVYIEQAEFIAPDGYRLTPRYGPVLEGRA